jgi:hypothetical protein
MRLSVFVLHGKTPLTFGFLVKHVAKAGSDLLHGISLDAFLPVVDHIKDGAAVAPIGIKADVDSVHELDSHYFPFLALAMALNRRASAALRGVQVLLLIGVQ